MTQTNYLPFALPDIGDEEINNVVECLKSGWLTTGKNAKQFEENFSEFLGGGVESIAVNSCTAGLLLALNAFGIGKGDEVIIPCYTFSATGMVVVHAGATPVMVDIDPLTMNICPKQIEAAITPRTKAIIPVHFAGLACEMDKIQAIANKHNLKVIEDAAHALPTIYNGKIIGAKTSDATVYSFYATKTITTGEGGMIVTADPAIAKKCRILRLHGISRDVFDRYTAKGSKWFYEITEAGHKCNLTDLAASIGIAQLTKAHKFQQKREEIAIKYLAAFKDLPLTLPAHAPQGDMHSWHLFVIRLNDKVAMTREEFIQKMDDQGIGTSVHFIPLHLHPYWSEMLGLKRGAFPAAEAAYDRAISLPIYTKMSDTEVERVIKAVRNILAL